MRVAEIMSIFAMPPPGIRMQARFEERWLSQELGAAAYADYRRRVSMLIPFWPMRG